MVGLGGRVGEAVVAVDSSARRARHGASFARKRSSPNAEDVSRETRAECGGDGLCRGSACPGRVSDCACAPWGAIGGEPEELGALVVAGGQLSHPRLLQEPAPQSLHRRSARRCRWLLACFGGPPIGSRSGSPIAGTPRNQVSRAKVSTAGRILTSRTSSPGRTRRPRSAGCSRACRRCRSAPDREA